MIRKICGAARTRWFHDPATATNPEAAATDRGTDSAQGMRAPSRCQPDRSEIDALRRRLTLAGRELLQARRSRQRTPGTRDGGRRARCAVARPGARHSSARRTADPAPSCSPVAAAAARCASVSTPSATTVKSRLRPRSRIDRVTAATAGMSICATNSRRDRELVHRNLGERGQRRRPGAELGQPEPHAHRRQRAKGGIHRAEVGMEQRLAQLDRQPVGRHLGVERAERADRRRSRLRAGCGPRRARRPAGRDRPRARLATACSVRSSTCRL